MNIIILAARLARTAHEGQLRKYSGTPYVFHPARVAARTALLPEATEEMVAAAFLHDVLEDTPVEAEDIGNVTGAEVRRLVEWLTNRSKTGHPAANRAERKRIDRERLAAAPREVKLIKLLDRIDNLGEMRDAPPGFCELYGQESLMLLEVIGDGDRVLAKELHDAATRLVCKGGHP